MVVVRRSALTDILADALAGGTVRNGVAVRELATTGAGVRITLSDSTTREAAAVIGADGTRSVVARHLNGVLTNRDVGYTAWRGVAECAIDPEYAGEVLGPAIEFGHVPLGPDRTYWFATERAREGREGTRRRTGVPADHVRLVGRANPGGPGRDRPCGRLGNDLYDRDRARVWSRGPVLVVGDAAHPMRPHLGQGGCQGLEDAAILANFADRADDLDTAFARFSAFRRRRVRAIVRESALLGRIIDLRPAFLSAAATRASVLVPEAVLTRHLAAVASRSAFLLPTRADTQPVGGTALTGFSVEGRTPPAG